MDISVVEAPRPSGAVGRFGARLRLLVSARRFVRGFDFRDVLTVVALGGVFIGLAVPSWAFGVTGVLLLTLTPIGDAVRVLIRGK